jgi:putative DNA primase/helicase
MNDLSMAALAYAGRGWRVHPVHTICDRTGRCTCGNETCEHPAKHPKLHAWPTVATTTRKTILQWWQRWPNANVGILTGDGLLLVLDVDPRDGGDVALRDLERTHGPLPDTPSVLTGGGGQHFYLRADIPVSNKVKIEDGLDIRGDGGFVVAPPSLHASGRRYVWDISAHPDDVPVAPAPQWLLALCARPPRSAGGSGEELRLVKGERNDRLFRLACRWRRDGVGVAALQQMVQAVNTHHVDPPLSRRELDALVTSVLRYPPGADDAATDALLARAFGLR